MYIDNCFHKSLRNVPLFPPKDIPSFLTVVVEGRPEHISPDCLPTAGVTSGDCEGHSVWRTSVSDPLCPMDGGHRPLLICHVCFHLLPRLYHLHHKQLEDRLHLFFSVNSVSLSSSSVDKASPPLSRCHFSSSPVIVAAGASRKPGFLAGLCSLWLPYGSFHFDSQCEFRVN